MDNWLKEARETAETQLSRAATPEEWNAALPRAQDKLRRIISREGDAGGARRESWYIGQLIAEQITAAEYSLQT